MVDTGGKRAEFWAGTLREIALDLEVAATRKSQEYEVLRWHTWWGAAMPLMKKFPDFKDWVPAKTGPTAKKPRQTEAEQIAVLRQWASISRAIGKNRPKSVLSKPSPRAR